MSNYIPAKRIYLCLAHMSGQEQRFIQEAFDTNWVVPLGPNVNAFEADLKAFVESDNNDVKKEVVALSTGTSAVHLALMQCGVGPGDEVIVQSFTFAASCNPVAYLGATPVFVDSEPETWNLSPELLEQAIEDRIRVTGRKPKAIVPVYLFGMPAKIDEIMAVAKKYGIPVIEDAAEGFGSKYKGRVCGTFGEYGVLSFNGNKMITTSGGGALVCPDTAAKQEVMFYATQARDAYPYYQHSHIGYNYRMSNICAGIGRGQMTVAADHISHHHHVCALYAKLLCGVDGVEANGIVVEGGALQSSIVPGLALHVNPSPDIDSNFWLCTITLQPTVRVRGEEHAYQSATQEAIGGAGGVVHHTDDTRTDCEPNTNIEALRVCLDKANVEVRPVWKPMHRQPVFAQSPAYVNGVSEALFKTSLCLPAGPCVTDDDVRYIAEKIIEAIEQ